MMNENDGYMFHRLLEDNNPISELSNTTLKKEQDVPVNEVLVSLWFNSIILVVVLVAYEILSRRIHSIYNSRKFNVHSSHAPNEIPPYYFPFRWMIFVYEYPWQSVRDCCGLDAYMFLRYLRLCFRITSATGIWAMMILAPIFASGKGGAKGWYLLSMANLTQQANELWAPTVFIWMFSSYIFYAMREEYLHFLTLRMDFLGRGDLSVNPQNHYSICVESIPIELRSDVALYDYFNAIYPGKVHSASVILELGDLENLSIKRKEIVEQLEQSIANYEATGERPSHRIVKWNQICSNKRKKSYEGNISPCGVKVDSIKYYCKMLNQINKTFIQLQIKNSSIGTQGNNSLKAVVWMKESARKIHSLSQVPLQNFICSKGNRMNEVDGHESADNKKIDSSVSNDPSSNKMDSEIIPRKEETSYGTMDLTDTDPNFEDDKCPSNPLSLVSDSLGLDFFRDSAEYVHHNIDSYIDSVLGPTMTSNGYVTFVDLSTATSVTGSMLTHIPGKLKASMAPEAQDVDWKNAHYDRHHVRTRKTIAGVLFGFGAILWSFPLTVIQAFATVDSLSQIPGLSGLLALEGGQFKSFINGYLPVVALIALIGILPYIFQWSASSMEHCKTYSAVQSTILKRYFYYQLANLYITVTAGSLWNSLNEILDSPKSVLELLADSFPGMVGYFVSFLITKTFASLPILLLNLGALFGRIVSKFSHKKRMFVTQRELDKVNEPQYLYFGVEYPTQLLVIMIGFTYSCIAPIILPVSAAYFGLALLIYKKQILYVYTPKYVSGGELFPLAMQRTLVGLIFGQVTLMGYLSLREGTTQVFVVLPLVFYTFIKIREFDRKFVKPSHSLSMEQARLFDFSNQLSEKETNLNADAYKQPVLREDIAEPLPYRSGSVDKLDEEINSILETSALREMLKSNQHVQP